MSEMMGSKLILFSCSKSRLIAKLTGKNIVVLIGYAVLSIAFTYPLAIRFATHIPGDGGDSWQFINTFWWFKKALLELQVNPYYNSYMFYPTGVSLASSTVTPFNTLLSIPIQIFFNGIIAYNTLFLISFILSGFNMYLLVKFLVKNQGAAFISGFVFAFAPYRLAHGLGHLNLITTQFIPLYLLFLIKMLETPTCRNAIFAGLSFALTALSSEHYALYSTVLTPIIVAFHLYIHKYNVQIACLLKNCLITSITVLIITTPFYLPLALELISGKANYTALPLWYVSKHSTDMLGFFTPSIFHPYLGSMFSKVYEGFTSNVAEATVFVGYACLVLAGYAIFSLRNIKVTFWAIIGLIFSMLSLGPYLHIGGKPYLALPYLLLYPIVPFHIPARLTVISMLCLSVLVGYGAANIIKSFHGNRRLSNRGRLIIAILSAILFFEFFPAPYPMVNTSVPSIYFDLAADRDDYAVLEVPISPITSPIPKWLYYQTVHEKRLVGGFVSRLPPYTLDFLNSPLISELACLDEIGEVNKDRLREGIALLRLHNVRYIIVHRDYLANQQFKRVETLLKEAGLRIVYDDGSVIAYIVPPQVW